jgi:beta-phosphoglucomutase-like phosphatase (HAD superfamily)
MAFRGAIFDVDGVLVDSPHELAWREAFRALMEGEWRDIRDQTSYSPERFTPAVYQQVMAGMPRMAGARAAMEHFGVPDIDDRVDRYAATKQEHVIRLIEEGRFMAFADALRFILAVKAMGVRVAAASSSKNAKLFLARIRLDTFAAEQRLDYDFIQDGMTLQELFDADISGRDFPKGKPDPAIFLTAAQELGVSPGDCFVVEDAPSGVQAAKAAGMAALGVARLGDEQLLEEAGADLVVTTLDDVSLAALVESRLEERRAAVELRQRHTRRPPSVWMLVYDGFDPARQGLREALCALGNGYFVTRGALPEAEADGVNYPGTYVAGQPPDSGVHAARRKTGRRSNPASRGAGGGGEESIQAERAQIEGVVPMPTYLVVANQTLGSTQLRQEIRKRFEADPDSFFYVLVPDTRAEDDHGVPVAGGFADAHPDHRVWACNR